VRDSELQRTQRHLSEPEKRFHYRHRAAVIADRAAGWMPRNSDKAAHMLNEAGLWLAVKDPEAADIYYQKLVSRHLQTDLGKRADARRWFVWPNEP